MNVRIMSINKFMEFRCNTLIPQYNKFICLLPLYFNTSRIHNRQCDDNVAGVCGDQFV